MDNLPTELFTIIASFLSYKDMIMFKSASKFIAISPEKILYDVLPKGTTQNVNLYSKYYLKQSYGYYLGNKNIKFTLSPNEKILYKGGKDLEYYIITFNNRHNFIIYRFYLINEEHVISPNGNYDINDIGNFGLCYTSQYSTLNDFKQLLSKDIKLSISNLNG
jgi:hypothetical protein